MYDGSNRREGLRVAIPATDGVEEAELTEPKKALDSARAETAEVAPYRAPVPAFRHHDRAPRSTWA